MQKRGPKPKFGERADAVFTVRVTQEQRAKLLAAAETNLVTVTDLIRDAVESYVADFSDEPMFEEVAAR
jgi:hypothetical protein